MVGLANFVVGFAHSGLSSRNGGLYKVLHFFDAFVELFRPGERGLPGLLERFLALIEKRQEIRGHEVGIVILQLDDQISLFDTDTFKDVPFLDTPGDLRFNILRPLIGRVGGQLAGDGNRLGPGDKGDNEEEQNDEFDGQPGGKLQPLGDLDGFPRLELAGGRQVVDGDVAQAALSRDE